MLNSAAADRPMTCSLHVAWDERLTRYDFGPGHPLAPVRIELTMALAQEFGVLSQPRVTVAAPGPAADPLLELIHDRDYIAAVKVGAADFAFGLGTPDNPVFPGMHDASALVTGATAAAAGAVWAGRAEHAVSVAGGLHHAMRAMASGFCVYNDPAIAIAWLLGQGAERIAYVDIDVHHGDGVQAAFYRDPRVLTISIHEHPMTLFPGTGLPSDTGGPGAEGSAVNVALPAGTGDRGWLRAFDAVVPPLLRAFRPQIREPARLRHPPAGPARAPGSERGRPAHRPRGRAPARARNRGWPVAAHRRRRLRAGPGGAAHLDAPAGRGGGTAAGPRPGHAGSLAGVCQETDGQPAAGTDDRRRARVVLALRVGLRPRRCGRPGDYGHPERGVSVAWIAAHPVACGRDRPGRGREPGPAGPRLAAAHPGVPFTYSPPYCHRGGVVFSLVAMLHWVNHGSDA